MTHTITTWRSARQRYRHDPFRYLAQIVDVGVQLPRVRAGLTVTQVPTRRGAVGTARVHVGRVGGSMQLARWGRGAYTARIDVWRYTADPERPVGRAGWHRETYTGHALGIRKWHQVNPVASARGDDTDCE